MKTRTEDRRVARTRQLLRDALVSLIIQKGYESVTVKDVTDLANVGRSTFYAHFVDKEQLLLSGLDRLQEVMSQRQEAALTKQASPLARGLAFSLPLFQHVYQQRNVCRAIFGRQGGAAVQHRVRRLLVKLVREDLKGLGLTEMRRTLPSEAVVHFAVGSLLAILSWWAEGRSGLSPEDADNLFRELTMPGVVAVLGS
ncbi:MAG: TetR/AcrR family transcriptional regulator [Acidobacteriales bacterium]|nr:TetR/AcrR family transcriptional regulator [Terriglobales bacterium]